MDCRFLRQTIGWRVYAFVHVCHLIRAEGNLHGTFGLLGFLYLCVCVCILHN